MGLLGIKLRNCTLFKKIFNAAKPWYVWVTRQTLLRRCRLSIEISYSTLNMWSKWVWNKNFLQNISVVLIYKLTQNPFDGPWHCKVQCTTYLLDNKILWSLLSHLEILAWTSPTPYMYSNTCTSREIYRALRLSGFETMAYESGTVVSTLRREHARGWVDPRNIVRQEEVFQ